MPDHEDFNYFDDNSLEYGFHAGGGRFVIDDVSPPPRNIPFQPSTLRDVERFLNDY